MWQDWARALGVPEVVSMKVGADLHSGLPAAHPAFIPPPDKSTPVFFGDPLTLTPCMWFGYASSVSM